MSIEIKIISCKGLTAFNFFQKLSIYTNASINFEDHTLELTQRQKQEQKTPVDEEGDGNPEWNHTITFDLRPLESISSTFENLSVVFEFRHQGQLFGDKIVGEVRVPVKTLVESIGIDVVRFVSYEVRSPEGKHNGILDFSYKVLKNNDDLEIQSGNNDNHVSSEIHFSEYYNNQDGNNISQDLHWEHHSHINHGANSDVRVSEYHHQFHPGHGQILNHRHEHHNMDPHSSSNPGKIQYPNIELGDWSANSSTPGGGNLYYPLPPGMYPPPLQYQWTPPRQTPPPPPPVIYLAHPYGGSNRGNYGPPGSNQQNSGYDGYRHW